MGKTLHFCWDFKTWKEYNLWLTGGNLSNYLYNEYSQEMMAMLRRAEPSVEMV